MTPNDSLTFGKKIVSNARNHSETWPGGDPHGWNTLGQMQTVNKSDLADVKASLK